MTEQPYEEVLAQDIQSLNSLILQINKYASKLEYEAKWDSNQDIRIRMFHHLWSLVESLKFIVYFSNYDIFWTEYMTKLTSQNDPIPRKDARKSFYITSRNGFFFTLMSVFELATRSLVRKLSGEPGNEPISKEFCTLRQKLGNAIVPYSKLFELLPTIRNCIHNNGVHVPTGKKPNPYTPITYKGITFEFRRFKHIRYANRKHMILYAKWVFEFFCFLAENEKVRSPELILDISAETSGKADNQELT